MHLFSKQAPDALLIEFNFDSNIRKSFVVQVEQCSQIKLINQSPVYKNKITTTPNILDEWLQHFHHKLQEVSLRFTRDLLKLHSFAEVAISDDGMIHRALSTLMQFNPSLFDRYSLKLLFHSISI